MNVAMERNGQPSDTCSVTLQKITCRLEEMHLKAVQHNSAHITTINIVIEICIRDCAIRHITFHFRLYSIILNFQYLNADLYLP